MINRSMKPACGRRSIRAAIVIGGRPAPGKATSSTKGLPPDFSVLFRETGGSATRDGAPSRLGRRLSGELAQFGHRAVERAGEAVDRLVDVALGNAQRR